MADRTCSIDGCERPHYGRGWCDLHYKRWWRHGDALSDVPDNKENGLRGFSPAAVNARKTHCINGHAFTPDNTYLRPKGRRFCRECGRVRLREWRQRQKVAG